jgi:hypothetical protein
MLELHVRGKPVWVLSMLVRGNRDLQAVHA